MAEPKVLTEEALKLAREIVAYSPMADSWREIKLSETMLIAEALIERMEPVKIRRPIGFRSFRCACGNFPTDTCKFCPNCGKEIQWM